MSDVSVYSYVNAAGVTTYIDDAGGFLYTGTWAGTTAYVAAQLPVVDYSPARYIAIVDNVGVPPRSSPADWSVMSLLYDYQRTDNSSTGTSVTAAAAYETATGAYAFAVAAYGTAISAQSLASAGTTAAAAAQATANEALTLVLAGTNAAPAAQATANEALGIAIIGTNTAQLALAIATAGTNAYPGVFALAAAGTNAATTAQATANASWIGTNIVWLLPDGTYFTNSVIDQTNTGDLSVCLMQHDNPMFYKVLPNNFTNKVFFDGRHGAPPVAIVMHITSDGRPYTTTRVTGIQDYGVTTPGYATFGTYPAPAIPQFTFGDYVFGDTIISGDSSSPAFCVINNEAVFIASLYTATVSPACGLQTNEVNFQMSNLSLHNGAPVYTLTPYDLSGFPDVR